MTGIYDFVALSAKGKEIELRTFSGQVLLIVNTASNCGFTSQYAGLEALQNKYCNHGFTVLAFPCNQFGGQEPGTDSEIENFCDLNYRTSFPLFSKIRVNGDSSHPLFHYLKENAPGLLGSRRIKWNFTKFLINKDGSILGRYAPFTRPESIESNIKALLTNQPASNQVNQQGG